MKSPFHRRIAITMLCMSLAPAGVVADEAEKRLIIEDIGLSTPESVEYYAAEDVYLVTNINGNPLAADGNGFISKLKPDGSVVGLKWIDGANEGVSLNAPKGAAIVGEHLFVADLNQVHVFELPGGKPLRSISIDGSTFLNGITPGDDDSVYVTDSGFGEGFAASGSDAVYQVWADGNYDVVVKGEELGHPNGIWNDGDRLVVVTFGSGKMLSIDDAGTQTAMPTPPTGALDGLVKTSNGHFLVSSWDGSAIYRLNDDDTFSPMAENLDAPADLGIDTKRNRLLVPLFKQNKVVILPL